ncbi:MAG: Rne/Rng family ribonuclease [Pseudomonadota bacterium]
MSNNKMLIDASHPEETRVAIVRGSRVDEFDFESEHKTQIRGNIYLAKVTRVEPSLQAAFVDYGGNRHGFLAFSEIHPDYYQIPMADREALLAAEAEDALRAAQDEADDGDDGEVASADGDVDDAEEAPAKPKRRRRSRRRGSKAAADAETTSDEDGEGADVSAHSHAEDEQKHEAADEVAGEDAADGDDNDGGEESDDSDDVIAAENDSDDVVSEEVTPEKAEANADAAPEEKPKKKRAPRKKAAARKKTPAEDEAAASEPVEAKADEEATEAAPEKPKRRRTSRKKATEETTSEPAEAEAAPAQEASADASDVKADDAPAEEAKPKRRRSRRKAADKPDSAEEATSEASSETDADAEASTEASPSDESEAGNGRKRRRRSRGRGRSKDADADTSNDDDEATAAPVESVGADDALEEVPVRRTSRRHYKIQEVIKRRQILLVQVVKEERGNKGAALTTYLSLAGRYSVLMPNTARGGGISRKITNMADRKRMKAIASGFDVPKGMGVILRTAGASESSQEIQRDFEYLMRLWENVRTLTLESTAPCLVYEEGSLIKRSIRDLYRTETGEVLVSGEEGYKEARDFMAMLMPGHEKSVRQYKDRVPLFSRMGVEDQLDAMLQPQVTLKSGGYLIIDQTEALVAIDVNSGRSTRQHSVEDTATQTNLEAADEVARQLRLRDLAGLIVIDFIDMDDRRNVRAVEKRLKDALKNDRARIQVGRISHFGLMEMSRQRIRASVLESTTQVCPTCGGVGYVKSGSSVALSVLRAIEEQLNKNARNNLTVRVSTSTALYMLNTKRDNLSDMENRFGVIISIVADESLGTTPCAIERGEVARRRPTSDGPVQVDTIDPAQAEEAIAEAEAATPERTRDAADRTQVKEAESNGETKPKRRRRRRKQNSEPDSSASGDAGAPEDKSENRSEDAASTEQTLDAAPKTGEPTRGATAPQAHVADEAGEEANTGRQSRTRRPRKPKSEKQPVEETTESTAAVSPVGKPPAEKSELSDEPPRPPRRNTRRVKAPKQEAETVTAAIAEEAVEVETVVAEQAAEKTAAKPDQKTDEAEKKGWWQRKFF